MKKILLTLCGLLSMQPVVFAQDDNRNIYSLFK